MVIATKRLFVGVDPAWINPIKNKWPDDRPVINSPSICHRVFLSYSPIQFRQVFLRNSGLIILDIGVTVPPTHRLSRIRSRVFRTNAPPHYVWGTIDKRIVVSARLVLYMYWDHENITIWVLRSWLVWQAILVLNLKPILLPNWIWVCRSHWFGWQSRYS